ncbi:MAG: hypothetical protein ABSF26_19680 [Thermoguttaceae bacterium]|jgi:hypothetical protein
MTFKAELRASIGWNWNQGALDTARLDYTKQLQEGCGSGQAEAGWHADQQTLDSGAADTLDLTALHREMLGADHTTTLVRVKGLLLLNDGSSTGRLAVGGAGQAEWSAPFGADGDSLVVPPDGAVLLVNRQDGWPVDDSHKLLKLAAVGGNVTYSLALVGTLNATGSGSSGAD